MAETFLVSESLKQPAPVITIINRISSGEIQSFKVGKNIRIPKIKVIEYILGARRCCL